MTAILNVLSNKEVPVGDHEAPEIGGWSAGQPGTGIFVAYTTVFSGAVKVMPSILCPGYYDYQATINTRTFAANRKQADDMALVVRRALHGFRPTLGQNKVRLMYCSQIGPVERMDDTNPKYWRVVDTYQADVGPV